MKSIIIGTAGHIDHGKTALVKALTGVDTDRLPEEKARGITIDIGFAHAQWEGFEVSFIDVPGHERFVKNMLAGIGGIDLLILVIAADESIMPQTREHFDICRLLSITSGIIVITKSDLVEEETLAVVHEEIAGLVKGSFLEAAPVFAVSSKTGDGIDKLKAGLLNQLHKVPQREPKGLFRLPVDRVFTLKGHGTVVTGTLIAGRVRKESFAEIQPSHRRVKIRSIHAHNRSVEEAVAGQRTALNLQGVEKEEVQRGDVLMEAEFLESSSLLDVKILLLQNSKPLLHNTLVRFHLHTSDVPARITLLGKEALAPGESAFAQLRLQRPISSLYGDRFILRKQSPLVTIGGGIILDHWPLKRARKSDASALERLQRLEPASQEERLALAVEQKRLSGAGEKYLKAKLGLQKSEILKLDSDEVLLLRDRPLLAISRTAEGEIRKKIKETLQGFHQQNALLPGIPKEELRTKSLKGVSSDIFEIVLNRAVSEKELQIQKDVVSLHGRTVTLSSEEELLSTRTESLLAGVGLAFPSLDELARELNQNSETVKKILYLLVRQNRAMKVGEDYFVHKQNWEDLKQRIRALKSSQKTLSVPNFKALFGITRKYAIPLLEQLDREGVTRRSGNERIIL